MYPAAALMEVVEAHQIRLEAVMDAVDMKTFGLMAAIGKIGLDNFREWSTMGNRGTAKQGRAPTGRLPYGYRTGLGIRCLYGQPALLAWELQLHQVASLVLLCSIAYDA